MSQQKARPYWRILLEPALILLLVGGLAAWKSQQRLRPSRPPVPSATQEAAPVAEAVVAAPVVEPVVVAAAPTVDPALVASAEESLDAASRDRARAEDREAQAQRLLKQAELEAAQAVQAYRALGDELRLPTASLSSMRTRGELLQGEVKQIESELRSLAQAPRPRKRPLLDRTPVARVIDGQEYHFELLGNRVTYIDLDRLVAQVKTDAQLQLRLAAGAPSSRPIISTVGPVGYFSIRYELGRSLPTSVESMLRSQGQITYSLVGWEIVPEREIRGETLQAAQSPASDFMRAINSLDPNHATITLWIYPDSFALYRQIGEWLHGQGFVVAARPLPAGMPIRGSPGGSMSAGQ